MKQEFQSIDIDIKEKIDKLIEISGDKTENNNVNNNYNISSDTNSNIDYKELITNLKNTISQNFSRIIEIPNLSENHKYFSILIKRFLEDNLIERFSLILNKIEKYYTTQRISIEEHNKKIKEAKDQLFSENKLIQEKNKNIKELEENCNKINQEKIKLQKDINNQNIKFNHELLLEKEKLVQKELTFLKNIREKDEKISDVESLNLKMTQEINEIHKEYSMKISELKKEITKLTIEAERNKNNINENNNNFTSNNNNQNNMNPQMINTFKNVKLVFNEFKETLDKLDKDKESQFKFKILESLIKENDLNYGKWKDNLRDMKHEFSITLEKTYELKLTKYREELNDCSFKLTKTEFTLNEVKEKNSLLVKEKEMTIKENKDPKELLENKDCLIEKMKESNKDLESINSKSEKDMEDLEMNLNKIKTEHNMNKDEIEYICFVIDDILVIFYLLYFI